MALDIALTHHEKFDGTGDPRGLAGDQIPLCGRIVALADVYDALTSRRAYKEAFGHEKAKAIITGDSGRHFDPCIVEAFLSEERQFTEIHAGFADGDGREIRGTSLPFESLLGMHCGRTLPIENGD